MTGNFGRIIQLTLIISNSQETNENVQGKESSRSGNSLYWVQLGKGTKEKVQEKEGSSIMESRNNEHRLQFNSEGSIAELERRQTHV